MGEIDDSKPIESVQTALSLFGHINDERKHSPTKDEEEVEKERGVERLDKELANMKVQLEAKDLAYKQALLKIDHHHKTADELTTLLNNSDLQKDFYITKYHEANLRIAQLESEIQASNEEKLQKEHLLMQKRAHIDSLQIELKQANELENVIKTELEKSKEEENNAQIEIALLKSKLADSKAAEARSQSEKSALYNALQQMGVEAEETRKENRLLKQSSISRDKNEDVIEDELESVKRELEVAMAKNGELRTRAEQAISRAEAAEKAKGGLEEQIKKRREHKERRKAALAALREESVSRYSDAVRYDTSAENYQSLGKVLNMKF